MAKPVKTAILPIAGLGTRFLPATSALPKEMLVVVDKPVLDYVVEEARAAGIERFIFVTGRNKAVIEDHFDQQYELEATLAQRGKHKELAQLQSRRLAPGQAIFTRQQDPNGLGHAVWCARHLVGNEPFAVLLPDVIIKTEGRGCLADMIEVFGQVGQNVVAVEAVQPAETVSYGVVGLDLQGSGRARRITSMVEKPAIGTASSNLILTGRYILQPEIMTELAYGRRGAGGEIQLTDAMCSLLHRQDFFAVQHFGRTFDCGSKAGWLAANVAFALERPELRAMLRQQLAAEFGSAPHRVPEPLAA